MMSALLHVLDVLTDAQVLMLAGIFAAAVAALFLLARWFKLPFFRLLKVLRIIFFRRLVLMMQNQADEIKGLAQNQEILLQNRELSLLNELRAQVRSVHEMQEMLEHFLRRVVQGLRLHSAVIQIQVLGESLEIPYKTVKCSCHCCERLLGRNCYCAIIPIHYHVFPIGLQENQIGQMAICSDQPLNEQSSRVLHSLAKQIEVTAENLRLWHELKQKEELRLKLLEKIIIAQEEERKRIARELHDETSQSLTSILLGLSVLSDKKGEPERSEQIRQLRSHVQETLQAVHDLAWQLRPSVLDKFGLCTALERFLDDYSKKYSMCIDLCIVGLEGNRLHPESEVAIYRMIQEALTNVARYAKARNVSVIVNRNKELLTVIIEDDGIGFDVKTVFSGDPSKQHLGLRGMQERAHLLGGVLTIESGEGSGTTIFVKIPVPKEEVSHEVVEGAAR